MFKYYTWKEHGYFKGQDLLSIHQIKSLLSHRKVQQPETFVTIQDYNNNGEIVRCPLYFDIDSPDLVDAYETMQELVENLQDYFSLESHVWFSGGKGFHVILPIEIRHSRCHTIAGAVARRFCTELDTSVYRTRSMWRVNNTYNEDAGKYKIKVNSTDALTDIYEASQACNNLNTRQVDYIANAFEYDHVVTALYELNKPKKSIAPKSGSFLGNMPPCLRTLWDMDAPPEGQRHQLAHLIARHAHRSGLTEEEALGLFRTHKFWNNIREHDYAKVIFSVYNTKKDAIGCKGGRDGEILRQYCTTRCVYNENLRRDQWLLN